MTHKASNINPNHIFVDTNVLVGGYSGDARFQKDADCLQLIYAHNIRLSLQKCMGSLFVFSQRFAIFITFKKQIAQ
jgi:hypothetical protein